MLNIKAQMSQLPKYINNIILTMQTNVYGAIIYGVKLYARVHFGSSEQKSVSARWLPTRRPNWKLDLSPPVYRLQQAEHSPIIAKYYYSTMRLILIYRPSEGGRLSRPRHCSKCADRAQNCVSQWFSWKHRNCGKRATDQSDVWIRTYEHTITAVDEEMCSEKKLHKRRDGLALQTGPAVAK